jgi:hypothetical protein
MFLPKIQNTENVEALWDTGAARSLITQKLANKIVEQGATVLNLAQPLLLAGIGDGSIISKQMIRTTMTLDTGVAFPLDCFIVQYLPYDLLVGSPFMCQTGIVSLLDKDKGITLINFKDTSRPIVYTWDSKTRCTPPKH